MKKSNNNESFVHHSLNNSNNHNFFCNKNTNNNNDNQCINNYADDNPIVLPYLQYIIYGGHLIIGIGSVSLYTNGVAYIEEITLPNQSTYSQAIFYGIGINN
jgi:hypothetical protein